jgi:hypothetical protein
MRSSKPSVVFPPERDNQRADAIASRERLGSVSGASATSPSRKNSVPTTAARSSRLRAHRAGAGRAGWPGALDGGRHLLECLDVSLPDLRDELLDLLLGQGRKLLAPDCAAPASAASPPAGNSAGASGPNRIAWSSFFAIAFASSERTLVQTGKPLSVMNASGIASVAASSTGCNVVRRGRAHARRISRSASRGAEPRIARPLELDRSADRRSKRLGAHRLP